MSTSTAFIADPPVAFRFVSFVSGERDWVSEEGGGTDLAWGRGGGRSALRCLVGTVLEGVSVGRRERGKRGKGPWSRTISGGQFLRPALDLDSLINVNWGGEGRGFLLVESRFCRSERSCILRGVPLPLPVVVRIPGQLEGWIDGKW